MKHRYVCRLRITQSMGGKHSVHNRYSPLCITLVGLTIQMNNLKILVSTMKVLPRQSDRLWDEPDNRPISCWQSSTNPTVLMTFVSGHATHSRALHACLRPAQPSAAFLGILTTDILKVLHIIIPKWCDNLPPWEFHIILVYLTVLTPNNTIVTVLSALISPGEGHGNPWADSPDSARPTLDVMFMEYILLLVLFWLFMWRVSI